MEHSFGKGKVLFKSKGFDKAESAHNAKSGRAAAELKALSGKRYSHSYLSSEIRKGAKADALKRKAK